MEQKTQTKKKEVKSYEKLCHDVREITKEVRNIDNLVITKHFKTVWEASTDEEKEKAWKMITTHNKKELNSWVQLHDSLALGELSWCALVHRAKKKQVKNYSRLTRLELLAALEKEDKDAG